MKKKSGSSRFILQRKGDFTVKTLGPNHCGLKDVLNIKYTFRCTCTPDSLDKRGFLFDQMHVQQFFDSLKQTQLSCEQFALSASRSLFKLVTMENKDCKLQKMELTLSPEPYMAELTFEWEK